MAYWRKLILFGDSLTQFSFQTHGWAAALADSLQRKADVLNRGFSGYNTFNAVDMLNLEFPSGCLEERDAVVIFFGANDSVLKNFDQHVPVEQYKSNLSQIVQHFVSLGVPKRQILLISPPPVDSKAWLAHQISENKGDKSDRDNANTKKYAEVAAKVAEEETCIFLDLYSAFMAQKNWEEMLCDGLHFDAGGNQLLTKLVLNKIEEWSNGAKINYPDWKEFYSVGAKNNGS